MICIVYLMSFSRLILRVDQITVVGQQKFWQIRVKRQFPKLLDHWVPYLLPTYCSARVPYLTAWLGFLIFFHLLQCSMTGHCYDHFYAYNNSDQTVFASPPV